MATSVQRTGFSRNRTEEEYRNRLEALASLAIRHSPPVTSPRTRGPDACGERTNCTWARRGRRSSEFLPEGGRQVHVLLVLRIGRTQIASFSRICARADVSPPAHHYMSWRVPT